MTELYEEPSTIVFTTPFPELCKINVQKDAEILDFGCGYGRVMKHLYEQGYKNLTGIDISEQLIQRAKKNLPQAEYIVGDITKDNISKQFDVIIICGVLEYINEINQRRKLASIISGYLKKGGILYLETFIRDEKDSFYETNAVSGQPYGTVKLSNGIVLFHGSIDEIDVLFGKSLNKQFGEETKFMTWTKCEVKGYIVVYKKG